MYTEVNSSLAPLLKGVGTNQVLLTPHSRPPPPPPLMSVTHQPIGKHLQLERQRVRAPWKIRHLLQCHVLGIPDLEKHTLLITNYNSVLVTLSKPIHSMPHFYTLTVDDWAWTISGSTWRAASTISTSIGWVLPPINHYSCGLSN